MFLGCAIPHYTTLSIFLFGVQICQVTFFKVPAALFKGLSFLGINDDKQLGVSLEPCQVPPRDFSGFGLWGLFHL